MADAEPTRRRRRRRASAPQGPPPVPPADGPGVTSATPSPVSPVTDAQAPPVPPPAQPPPASEPSGGRAKSGPRRGRDGNPERGLRDLVGAGHSQVGVSGALRARDVNRPTEEDLAEAEESVVVVRRNWKPHGDPPR